MRTPTRPALRYHGGKWRLAPWVISHFPTHRVYVEPFGGAASVLVRKDRSYAEVYNDLNADVVNLFRVLRERGGELVEAVYLTPFARDEFEQSYQPCDDPLERARRLVFRSFAGFGSSATRTRKTGFRGNTTRSGTTPAGDWANYPEPLAALVERLRGVVIENRDASLVMAAHDAPTTLFFVDPPYLTATRSGHDSCVYDHEMTDAQHVDLLNQLLGLEGMVVLSGYPSEMYDNILIPRGWKREEKAAHADGARDRTECLWVSPTAQKPDLFS